MTGSNIALWAPSTSIVVPDTLSDPATIAAKALQLRDRERNQIATNFQAGHYEVASTFVWMRTMALLKKQLGTLGNEFIGELLQRPDFDEFTDIRSAISDSEAISLARDLGILTPLQTTRLLHSQAIVTHFAGIDNDPSADLNEVMTQEEAVSCLRVCVQGVLGHEKVSAAEDFQKFRAKLSAETLAEDAPEIIKLRSSPYFFVRTAISILLSLIRTEKGAQLEHAARNSLTIIPSFWNELKAPERWQIGQAYAQEFSEGKKDSVKALHAVLLKVNGFDFVPENLRSTTFIQVANAVIAAHQGMNNFYNEAAPMRELAALGTSIPGPALAVCITASLCVKLGNFYGRAWNAQQPADQLLSGLSSDRWAFYLNERLPSDRLILSKLREDKPMSAWIELIAAIGIDLSLLTEPKVRALVQSSAASDKPKISRIATEMLTAALG